MGLGRRQRVRRKLRRFEKALQDSCDCLHAVWVTSIRSDTDHGEWHPAQKSFMSRLKSDFGEVLDSCESVFSVCLEVVCSGALTDQDEEKLKKRVAELRIKETSLARKFCQVRHQMGRGASSLNTLQASLFGTVDHSFLETLSIAHPFAFNLSRFSKVVCDLADDLILTKSDPSSMPLADRENSITSTFTGISDIAHQMWTIRALASIFAAFCIGYAGWGSLLGEYNAG